VYVIPLGPLGTEVATSVVPEPRVLFFGRMHRYKGLQYFVEAVTALRRDGHPIVGVVAGRGPDLARNRQSMDAAGCFEIHDKYIPAKEVAGLFIHARAVVLPYTDGTQSAVAAMALGYGRPVIASAVGSIPELVQHGVNGLLTPPRNVTSLKAALEAVITDDQLVTRLSAGARRLRDGPLSWRAIAEQTLAVYDRLVIG
jgi:glycosyltransferase involved in cell wall biosynthesis